MPTHAVARPAARATVLAVFAIFFVNGLLVGTWGGSLAGLRERLGVNTGQIGLVLVITGLCAIASMQIGGRLADRMTPRLPSLVSGIVLTLGVLAAAFAPSYGTLLMSAFLIGVGNGTMDVAMNAFAVDAEKASGRAIMSRFHAFFSLGGFAGAGIILVLARLRPDDESDPRAAMLTVVALCAIAFAALFVLTPRAPHTSDGDEVDAATGIPPQAWLLGVMALFFGFTEGTAIDWASIHVTDVAHVSPGTGAAGLVAVSATMVLIRLAGDALVTRLGRVAVVRFGAPVAVAGYLMTAFTSALPLIIAGWLLVGLGVGMIAPQIYGIAGHLGGGKVLAIVTGFGYTAFLAGPGLVGFISTHIGIQRTMLAPLAAGVLLTALTFTRALAEPETA